nr:MAG TPA: hypothetical protein [Caudoviricetes sp.]
MCFDGIASRNTAGCFLMPNFRAKPEIKGGVLGREAG